MRDNIIDNLDSQLEDAKKMVLEAQEKLESALAKECSREDDQQRIKELEKRLESISYESQDEKNKIKDLESEKKAANKDKQRQLELTKQIEKEKK